MHEMKSIPRFSLKSLLLAAAMMASVNTASAEDILTGNGLNTYKWVPGWCELPGGAWLGNTHGGIVVDKAGNVYFNTDTDKSICVYSPEGKFLRYFADEFPAIHGMAIREENGEEFIYAAHLRGKQAVKFKLNGTVVWTIGYDAVSDSYSRAGEYNPTGIAVGPDGDIYIADGYGKSLIHQFDKDRKFIRTFGSKGGEPGQFVTCHGISLDTRSGTPLLLVCDRENRRLQHFDLEGNFVSVITEGLRRPCSVSILGDLVAVAELQGRVTILDKNNHPIAFLGDNPDTGQWAKNPVPPEAWNDGIFTAPHGISYDAHGNLYVMDWNKNGRVNKLEKVYKN